MDGRIYNYYKRIQENTIDKEAFVYSIFTFELYIEIEKT